MKNSINIQDHFFQKNCFLWNVWVRGWGQDCQIVAKNFRKWNSSALVLHRGRWVVQWKTSKRQGIATKSGTDFLFIYYVIHVDYIMLVNFLLIDGLHSLFLLQIDYFRANLEVAFPKDFQGFVKGAFCGLFSIRFQLRAPPLFGDACPNKHVRSLISLREFWFFKRLLCYLSFDGKAIFANEYCYKFKLCVNMILIW